MSNAPKPQRSATRVAVQLHSDGESELLHPRCAKQRREDLEEVEKMIAAGETEIARDELRWLLQECHDCLGAHKLLGDIALAEKDYKLARGHYGYAYQLVVKAIEQAGGATTLPYRLPSNQVFHQSARGLILSLQNLGKRGPLREVVDRILKLDPRDPMNLRDFCQDQPKSRPFRPKHRRGK